jgi:hypothetical protein
MRCMSAKLSMVRPLMETITSFGWKPCPLGGAAGLDRLDPGASTWRPFT